ncbi:beta,beta-carotene 15,15'-dioxygenase isoform X1 [Pangasianodon hypophthalmus]|uniref:beta,beta-carotene 15,15'-dioxygenase isoform X1 n=2 Tax=Pangasianodon hypophthalmus TaxID=310915 RepID=UPI00147A26BA|nr:beta,beta-carotene 15,15'-dioxygenase isoform X1 [Pangasianodon hypophthalmus]
MKLRMSNPGPTSVKGFNTAGQTSVVSAHIMQAIFCRNGTETPEPVKAEVSGAIPPWLQGTLLRNGPGLFSIGNMSYNHWFDGMSLIHSFTFKQGDVYYRSKFLRSDTYMKNITANRIVVSEFGTMAYPDPCKNIFSKAFSYMLSVIPDFTDNNIVNIIRYGDDYYTSSEINYINQINPVTLDTMGRVNYRNHIALNLATAHPHYDDEGNTYNMGTAIMALSGPRYVIFKVPAATSDTKDSRKKNLALKNLQQICSIPFRSKLHPSYFHSFGMTDNYIIFVEQPLKLDIIRLATAYFRGVSWGKCLSFDKDDVTLFHIIDRKTGLVLNTKFYGDAFVVFHHINAYEEDGHVVFDLITYKDSSVYDLFYIDYMKQDTQKFTEMSKDFSPPVCQRFVIPVNADLKENPLGKNLVRLEGTSATAVFQKDGSLYCTPETLFHGLELPGINYQYNRKKYRYFYGSMMEWSPQANKIAKVDTNTKTHLEWIEEDCYPSEPKFVASPGAVDEDDGVILSSVVSVNPKKSPFMLVLDAKTFKEIARASVNTAVHLDLHGIFIPQESEPK